MSFLPRVPVPLLGLLLAVSSLQVSCVAQSDSQGGDTVTDGRDVADAGVADAPSDDSPDDRADGMSYGDGYGK